jgi:hypothetical protein
LQSPSADFTWRKPSAAKGAFSIAGGCKDEQAERGGKRRHMTKGQRAMIAAKIFPFNEKQRESAPNARPANFLRRLKGPNRDRKKNSLHDANSSPETEYQRVKREAHISEDQAERWQQVAALQL